MQLPTSADLLSSITQPARDEPTSGIIAAARYGWARGDVIPLWTGEGHLPTPEAFARPAMESLARGETFYTWQRGIPELREALARYHTRHYGRDFSPENFFVTGGGMQAIQTAIQMILGEGDEIIIPSPAWPNYAGPIRLQGSVPVEVPMTFANDRWTLDLDRLFDKITPRTRAICVNSPSNPLGWTAGEDELVALRDECRKRGLWIIADEVYSRFYYRPSKTGRAPSFLDVCDTEERLLLTNTFSKNWAMTGWRVGWLQAPKALGEAIERIIQYNTSGTPAFLQRGCAAALDEGEAFILSQVDRARANRDRVTSALGEIPSCRFEAPAGAFYLFFSLEGLTSSIEAVYRLIDEAGVGLAPGGTFGAGGEGFLRMCFLRNPAQIDEAVTRLVKWLKNRHGA
ncbi:pyridoxal phosphate-dependent aminotransferase [soil metagenome]